VSRCEVPKVESLAFSLLCVTSVIYKRGCGLFFRELLHMPAPPGAESPRLKVGSLLKQAKIKAGWWALFPSFRNFRRHPFYMGVVYFFGGVVSCAKSCLWVKFRPILFERLNPAPTRPPPNTTTGDGRSGLLWHVGFGGGANAAFCRTT
jgi:hypothetical protein